MVVMTWEDKGEIIRLCNEGKKSSAFNDEYHEFVLKHIDEFDGQVIDMFINNETLTMENIIANKEFFRTVNKKFTELMKSKTISNQLSFRGDIRIGILEQFLNEL